MKIRLPILNPQRQVAPHKKPGPKTQYGGTRLNFLPGEKLRKAMLDLKAEAKQDFNIKLSQSYILREGAIYQIELMKSLFEKARKGQLGPKRRGQLLEAVRA